jgi:IMP cyclohydrolase
MIYNLSDELKSNAYPGRGIIIGRKGGFAVIAYFIMGRSENSRNRVFEEFDGGIRTKAYDEGKLTDPSLIIYSPVRVINGVTIVTNGDQTDTVYEYLKNGKTFTDALRTRTFEPDAPNFTPRVSAVVDCSGYKLSILKSSGGNEKAVCRFFYEYENPIDGQGRFIHTYKHDGNPIPSFEGEPKTVEISGNIDEFTNLVWNNLDYANKVSLFVRYIDVKSGESETRIVNKHS